MCYTRTENQQQKAEKSVCEKYQRNLLLKNLYQIQNLENMSTNKFDAYVILLLGKI